MHYNVLHIVKKGGWERQGLHTWPHNKSARCCLAHRPRCANRVHRAWLPKNRVMMLERQRRVAASQNGVNNCAFGYPLRLLGWPNQRAPSIIIRRAATTNAIAAMVDILFAGTPQVHHRFIIRWTPLWQPLWVDEWLVLNTIVHTRRNHTPGITLCADHISLSLDGVNN